VNLYLPPEDAQARSQSLLAAPYDPIALDAALEALRNVAQRYCFDSECPVCGQPLNAGDRHECRLTSGPPLPYS
jgi:hypothetical protein